jgi:tRNA(Ile)-lysidine synthase
VIKPLLSTEWSSSLSQYNKLIVGFSGGLDSTVLLHVLASHSILLSKLVAVHVNHGISANSSLWQIHCEQFCHTLGISLITQSVQFDCSANIEGRARAARYSVFSSLLTKQDCLILGHHLDDQAETFLLQLFRGSGIDGLSAMAEIGQFELGMLARPFLSHSRKQLEYYATWHQLPWIEDESNQDTHYARNYLRNKIIPSLQSKWPGVAYNIARSAIHCQQAKRNLESLALNDFSGNDKGSNALGGNSLFIEPLKELGFDRITNILRVWLKYNRVQLPSTVTFHRLIHEVIFANHDAVPKVAWGDVLVRRYQEYLYLDRKNENNFASFIEWSAFPLPLTLENVGFNLLAKKAKQGLVVPSGAKIIVTFRQGGESIFWHGQTKRLKKLFQEWGVPPWLRERVPLIYFNDTLAAVLGYAMSDLFFTKKSPEAWIFIQHKSI